MSNHKLSDEQLKAYNNDGYTLIPGLFENEEIDLLRSAAKSDQELDKNARSMNDGTGMKVRLCLWNHPGEGIYGMYARCHRMVNTVEQILGDEAYHYH